MPEEQRGGPPAPESDNVQRIRHLVRMMQRFDLTAIDLVEGETKIRLRRGSGTLPTSALPSMPAPAVAPVAQPTATTDPAPSPSSNPPAPSSGPEPLVIESPMVGTLYLASSPDSPSFVSVGSVIKPDSTVCIIEAMKVFTEIPAGISGRITEVLVGDKQAVEFGQPLFRVEPS